LAGNKLDATHLKYALFLTSLVKGMMAVFQPGCEQLGNPRVSNLRFRPIPKHLAGTPIIIVVEDGTGETGSGCPSKVEVPTRLLRCQRNVLSNVVVVSELKRLELQNDFVGAAEIAKSSSRWWATTPRISLSNVSSVCTRSHKSSLESYHHVTPKECHSNSLIHDARLKSLKTMHRSQMS
jgi:hypothetical protein